MSLKVVYNVAVPVIREDKTRRGKSVKMGRDSQDWADILVINVMINGFTGVPLLEDEKSIRL
jgi:hypothetical protein